MYCTSCSTPIRSEDKFCSYCGTALQQKTSAKMTFSSAKTSSSFSQKTFDSRTYTESGQQYEDVVAAHWKRLIAITIDTFILTFPVMLLRVIPVVGWLSFLLFPIYFAWFDRLENTPSFGKRAMKIRVVRLDGNSLGWPKAIWRTLLKVYFAPSYITAFFSDNQQAMHDMVANTIVVERKEIKQVVKEPILDDLELGDLSRKVKSGLSNMPGVTIVGDVVMSLSGVKKQMEYLRDEPQEPINWLQYYECVVTYEKMKSGVSFVRLVTNPAAYMISKGVGGGLNALDDEHKPFDPLNCLKQAVVLSYEKLKLNYKAEDLAILSKAYFYLGINEVSQQQAENYLKKAIQYLSKAIELEKSDRMKAEYFFYLGQFYEQVRNEQLQYKSLNLSRKLGFEPSLQLIRRMLQEKGATEEELAQVELPLGVKPITRFRLIYKPSLDKKMEDLFEDVVSSQAQKFKKTKDTIKNML